MIHENDHEIDYSYRLIGVHPKEIENLKQCFNKCEYSLRKYKDTETYVVVFKISAVKNYGKLFSFINSCDLENVKKGLYISLVTYFDQDGVSVPSHVLTIYQRLGGDIDFSFVFLEEN